ncbi:hypothetical protein IEN91_05390 [Bacillus velezensis]|uniref:hypothetical protein n=1 Tax=Bacillus velezensis TaxID=492670 RepID=UPI0018C49482|nr:hypothetical protein [Bacillus velezensis]QPK89873.1 hypothetical protein IEN91_05390 [Bacillus velezensis]
MNKSTLELRYVLYTVACDDLFNHERALIACFDEDPTANDVEEVIHNLRGADHEYDYALVEKQYHRI